MVEISDFKKSILEKLQIVGWEIAPLLNEYLSKTYVLGIQKYLQSQLINMESFSST